jgi:hypothetical protein
MEERVDPEEGAGFRIDHRQESHLEAGQPVLPLSRGLLSLSIST